jgi:protoporphyrinogen/coproporphyrinogen III oxidase
MERSPGAGPVRTDGRVLVLGGGITGLSAAFELHTRGVPFTLVDASHRLGGLILTEREGGFVIEAGPDSVLAQKPAALDLCRAIGLGGRIIATRAPRTAYVLRDGRLFPLPSPSVLGVPVTWRGLARYDLLSWPARLRLACEPLVPRHRGGDESVAAFFRRRFGRATVDLVAQPLLGGIHAGEVEQLSMPSLFPRLAEAEARRGSVLRAFRHEAPRPDGFFRSLAGGMDELVRALVARLPPGSLRLGATASRLERTDRGWAVTAGPERLEGRAVVLAVPAHAAGALLEPVSPPAAALCREVPYVSTASVALAWRRGEVPHGLEGSGFVVARRRSALCITACTWVSSKWDGRAPEGHVLLRAFVGGAHDPDAVRLDDEALIDLARRDLSPVLGMRVRPHLARVHRWVNAGAQHHVGQAARVAAIERHLAHRPGLLVAGSGFRAVGIPDCVADGRAAAAAAAAFATMTAPER